MASRYWIGAAGGNWSVTTNWSATDGGASVGAIPTALDDVFFTPTNNNSCVLDTAVAKVALSLTIVSGYTGTLTFNVNLSVSGSINVANSAWQMTGNGRLRMIAAGTWTTNGKTIGVPVEIGGTTTFTCTLAGALTVGNDILLTNTTSTIFSGAFDITCLNGANGINISGSQTITLSGNLISTQPGGGTGGNALIAIADANVINGAFELRCGSLTVTGALTGTATVRFTDGGTTGSYNWGGAAACSCSVIIDMGSKTLNLSGVVLFAASGAPTLTYSTGTISGTGTLSIASACTIVGGDWGQNNLNLTAALTLTLNTSVSRWGSINFPNAAVTLAGNVGLTAGTWQNTVIASSAKTITLTQGNVYTCTQHMDLTGATSALTLTLASSSGSLQTQFVVGPGADQDTVYLNGTRIDSSAGQTVQALRGTLTTTTNWVNQVPVNNAQIRPTMLVGM